MAHLIERLNEMTPAIAVAYRTKAEIEVTSDVPVLKCQPELNEEIVAGLKELEPDLHAIPAYHAMGSEDFAFISQMVPSSYMCIGAGIEDVSARYVEHNPKVRFNESVLAKGAAVYAGAAMSWLERHGER